MLNNLQTLISLFHDGCITSYEIDNRATTFKIEVEYLAKLYNRRFSYFFLRLYDMKDVLLTLFKGDSNLLLTCFQDIFRQELEIIRAELTGEGRVVIYSQVYDNIDNSHYFAELSFSCSSFAVYDEAMVDVESTELKELAARYWGSNTNVASQDQ